MLFEESKGDTWLLQSFNASRNFEVLWKTRGEGDISLFLLSKVKSGKFLEGGSFLTLWCYVGEGV